MRKELLLTLEHKTQFEKRRIYPNGDILTFEKRKGRKFNLRTELVAALMALDDEKRKRKMKIDIIFYSSS